MRTRLALAAVVAALAAAPFGATAQASVNCHHTPWLCQVVTTACHVSDPTYRLCSLTA